MEKFHGKNKNNNYNWISPDIFAIKEYVLEEKECWKLQKKKEKSQNRYAKNNWIVL